MSIGYIDAVGRDRSKRLALLIRLSDIVPERIARSLWFRLLAGSSVMWSRDVVRPTSGTLRLSSKFIVRRGCRFDISGNGRVDFADGVALGFDTHLGVPDNGSLIVGRDSYIGTHGIVDCSGGVTIGADVLIGPYCSINSSTHGMSAHDGPYKDQIAATSPINIEDNVWIASHCTITMGVTIGTGAIVAAGAVVTKDVTPYTLVAGVPARVLRNLRSVE